MTGTLKVMRAIGKGRRVKLTKTRTRRTVDVAPDVVAWLVSYVDRAELDALTAPRPEDDDISRWMFPHRDGGPQEVRVVSRRFREKVLRRTKGASLHHRLYDFRHSCVCHLLAGDTRAGIPPAPVTFVARQIGDSPATVMRHYAEWIPSTDPVWIERLETLRKAGLPSRPWHQEGTKSDAGGFRLTRCTSEIPDNAREFRGEPSGTRTQDPLIKSQVL